MRRGEIWWASLSAPTGSEPGYRRPVVIVSHDAVTATAIRTVIVAVITSNLWLAEAPGNFRIAGRRTGLSRPSVVNVSQLLTIDKGRCTERVGCLDAHHVAELDRGLRFMLALS